MALSNIDVPRRSSFRYQEPSVPFATMSTNLQLDPANIDFNPLGLLAGLPAIPALAGFSKRSRLPVGAEDIYNLMSAQKRDVTSGIDEAQKKLMSGLYGRGLYKTGESVGDVANLRGKEIELMNRSDAMMAQYLMQLNQQELAAQEAQKGRLGDIGQLFASLATVAPFLL